MKERSANKLCCIVGNNQLHGDGVGSYCTCMFRFCEHCLHEIYAPVDSKYFREYNSIVDAHMIFDPLCEYNIHLRARLKQRYESQAKNEASQEGKEHS